jgi:hypothetical protein
MQIAAAALAILVSAQVGPAPTSAEAIQFTALLWKAERTLNAAEAAGNKRELARISEEVSTATEAFKSTMDDPYIECRLAGVYLSAVAGELSRDETAYLQAGADSYKAAMTECARTIGKKYSAFDLATHATRNQ